MNAIAKELLQRSVRLEATFTESRDADPQMAEYYRLRARFLALPGYSKGEAEETASEVAFADWKF